MPVPSPAGTQLTHTIYPKTHTDCAGTRPETQERSILSPAIFWHLVWVCIKVKGDKKVKKKKKSYLIRNLRVETVEFTLTSPHEAYVKPLSFSFFSVFQKILGVISLLSTMWGKRKHSE